MSTRRRSAGVVVAASLLLAALLVTTNAGATPAFSFTRFAGTDRYDTARLVADTFPAGDVVVIASGTSYADALAGTYAAGLTGAPILLTERDAVPAPTAAAITKLGATKALIIGGTSAVGAGAEAALKARGMSTTRIAGATRYATSKAVAESGGTGAVGRTGPASAPTAVVASGESFPDALSAGPMGYASHLPIILTTAAALSPDAQATLSDLGIRSVLVVGGTSAVSTATETAITAMGIVVTRLAGSDRTETATKVADHEIANLGFAATHVDLSRGDAFADALAGAAHSGKVKAPALLTTNATTLGVPTKSWLSAHAATLATGHVNGGTGAVSSAVEAEATSAARSTTTTSSSPLPTLPIPTTFSIPTTIPNVPPLVPCTPPQQGPGQPFCF
ncbi:MAG: cell wall-binding repeat-containing protein [Actinomycetia bacterium]|nr:cell wall-binding repeat-containing protein [Actinomycetes bacterium]